MLALRNSYHGRSFATVGITGNRGWSASSLTPFTVHYIDAGHRFPNPTRSRRRHRCRGRRPPRCILTATAGDVACLIAEPIQGVGGFTVPPDGLFGAMKKVLDEYGILYISDEVQTGWGRTGDHWGYEAHGLTPDLLTFAKGLGNGLSMAVGRGELVDGLTANSISTFGGNLARVGRGARQPRGTCSTTACRPTPGCRAPASTPSPRWPASSASSARWRSGPHDRRRAGRARRPLARWRPPPVS